MPNYVPYVYTHYQIRCLGPTHIIPNVKFVKIDYNLLKFRYLTSPRVLYKAYCLVLKRQRGVWG